MESDNFKKVLAFEIQGKFAHFKKFYSNKSSLTYKIPPRTVIMGMIASVLEEPRDSYYDWLSQDKSKIGVKIINPGITHFECMNYLHHNGGHTQVRLELLKEREAPITYRIYFTTKHGEKMQMLHDRLNTSNLGYGIYFGQRQFIGHAGKVEMFEISGVEKEAECEITTLTYKENILELNHNKDTNIVIDRMPVSFSEFSETKKGKQEVKGRLPDKQGDFVFDENGNNLSGKFKQSVLLENNERISFFTPLGG